MKKGIILLCIILCATAVFAGGSQEKSGEVVLQFWGAIPPEQGPQELVDNFNKLHEGEIRVEYTRFVNDDGGNTRLETALMAGEVDVFINYPVTSLEKRINAGLFYPIDEYLERDGIDLEKDFGPHKYVYNDHYYFIPTYGGPNAYIMYNMDMIEEAGIEFPENWTWEDYCEIAKKLTHGEGDEKVYGASIGSTILNVEWAELAKEAYNGDYMYKPGTTDETNFDAPAFKAAMQMRYQMEVVDQSAIPYMDIKTSKMDVAHQYAQGKVAMVWANYHLRDIKNTEDYPHDFKTGFVIAPAFEENQEAIYSGGLREWIGISPESEHKDEAWEFLKYYATEGYYPMCRSNRIPAWKGADPTVVSDLILGENKEELFDVAAFEHLLFDEPRLVDLQTTKTEGSSQLAQMMGEEFESVLLGQKTVDDALVSLKTRGDALLQSL